MNVLAPNDCRYEVKFVTSEIHLPELLAMLAVHPASFRVAFPTRLISSIYFDSFEFSTYRANVWGISSRKKIRYRWYGPNPFPDAGQLEIKHKQNRVNWKDQFRLESSPYSQGATWRVIRQNLLRQLPGTGKVWLHEYPQPVVIIKYTRQYFHSADKQIRITVDSQQQAYDQRYSPYPNILHPINMPKTVVLEFKCTHEAFEMLTQSISHFPIRLGRHSKYCTALKATQGF